MTSRHLGAPLYLPVTLAWGFSSCPPCQHAFLISQSCSLLELISWVLPRPQCCMTFLSRYADMSIQPTWNNTRPKKRSCPNVSWESVCYGVSHRSMVASRTAKSLKSLTSTWLSTQESCMTEGPYTASPPPPIPLSIPRACESGAGSQVWVWFPYSFFHKAI